MPGSHRRQLAVQVHDRVARIEEADEAGLDAIGDGAEVAP